MHCMVPCTKLPESLGVVVALGSDEIHLAQDPTDEELDPTITTKTLCAQPAIDDRHFRTIFLGRADQVRPQFELRQYEHRRLNPAHRAAGRPGEIERGVEDG